jgi:hypothetical protein
MIGGLIIAVDLGRKLGNVIGKLNEVNTSEKELANTQKDLNKLMAERAKLQEKVNAGDSGAQEKLDNINKEISQREGLIKVLEREVAARAGGGSTSPTDAPEMGGAASPVDTGLPVDNKEAQKTAILEDNIALRLAAAQREAELYSQIDAGMTAEAIKNAEDRNAQLNAIDSKKAEIDSINRDLARTGINENEKSILESKKSVAEQELALMDQKFADSQTKTIEQEAIDMEKRIAAKQILNQALTEQETIFLEGKGLKMRKIELLT